MQSSQGPWVLCWREGWAADGWPCRNLVCLPNFAGWWLSRGCYPLLQCCSMPVCSHAVGQAKLGVWEKWVLARAWTRPSGERKDSQRQRNWGMLPGWILWFVGRVCCLFARLSLLPSIYHMKNQLQYVALLCWLMQGIAGWFTAVSR